jgi:hypothetical protein
MGQLLITKPAPSREWYHSIVSIRNYSEPDFEDKLFKYGEEVFDNFHVLKFKGFTIENDSNRSLKYKPDLLLIAKDFKKWLFVEVELVKQNMTHTYNQIECFLNPHYNSNALADYIIKQNSELAVFDAEIRNLISNYSPGVLVIFDSHSQAIFANINKKYPRAKICVFEVHRAFGHVFEAYRVSGDYPYDITNTSKLIHFDDQHYNFSRPDIISSISSDNITLYYDMEPINATLIRGKKKKDTFLKIADNPFPKDVGMQFSLEASGKFILQRI